MAVHPLDIPNDTTADVVSPPIQGKPARILANAQGRCWEGIGETRAISERVAIIDIIDAQGDALLLEILRIASEGIHEARQRGEHYSADAFCKISALGEQLWVSDEHEDDQRGHVKAHAIGATAATLDASQQIGTVLGQRDALCGRTRGEAGGIEFEPCSQPAGHASDGKVCVFLARERPANWTAGPNLRPMGAPVGGRAQMEAVGRWSRSHRACVACHRNTVPHAGHGLCRSCYPKHRPQEV